VNGTTQDGIEPAMVAIDGCNGLADIVTIDQALHS
jgi:hypothetical protein